MLMNGNGNFIQFEVPKKNETFGNGRYPDRIRVPPLKEWKNEKCIY